MSYRNLVYSTSVLVLQKDSNNSLEFYRMFRLWFRPFYVRRTDRRLQLIVTQLIVEITRFGGPNRCSLNWVWLHKSVWPLEINTWWVGVSFDFPPFELRHRRFPPGRMLPQTVTFKSVFFIFYGVSLRRPRPSCLLYQISVRIPLPGGPSFVWGLPSSLWPVFLRVSQTSVSVIESYPSVCKCRMNSVFFNHTLTLSPSTQSLLPFFLGHVPDLLFPLSHSFSCVGTWST